MDYFINHILAQLIIGACVVFSIFVLAPMVLYLVWMVVRSIWEDRR